MLHGARGFRLGTVLSVNRLQPGIFGGIKRALRIPSLSFQYLEGQAAPQNSFVSNTAVVSIPTPGTQFKRLSARSEACKDGEIGFSGSIVPILVAEVGL